MNPDVKVKWIEALRSGEYEQAVGTLTYIKPDDSGFKHCCLGVLCELAVKEGLPIKREEVVNSIYYDNDGISLPDSVMEWAGLTHPNPSVGAYTAAEWNDCKDRSFTEIADLIEEHL